MPEEVFTSKANRVYKRDYAFSMNVMEEIFEIRSCIEIYVAQYTPTFLISYLSVTVEQSPENCLRTDVMQFHHTIITTNIHNIMQHLMTVLILKVTDLKT